MAGGRPSIYTQELADLICKKVATNSCGLRKLCHENPDLPVVSTINEWRFDKPEFSAQYARAKLQQADLLAEEIIDIGDDSTGDIQYDKDGNESLNGEYVARSRLRIDTRKWLASKLLPKAYGDHKSSDEVTVSTTFIEKLLEKK